MEIEKFLVESALLTHGLKSVTNEEIIKNWKCNRKNIVWVYKGKITLGNIEEFIFFRNKSKELIRIDCFTLEEAIENKLSGALTASGTMKVCEKMGIKLAVTCGMGGIGDIKGEELCPDLPALKNIPVSLISTSPKDMLDIEKTLTWLTNAGVKVVSSEDCTGYIFNSTKVSVEKLDMKNLNLNNGKLLILNPIKKEDRVKDLKILKVAIEEGKKAEKRGEYYHPAVNGKIDELTKGYSSYIQLKSIIENISLGEKIILK